MKAKCKNCGDIVIPVDRGGTDVTPCSCFMKSRQMVNPILDELTVNLKTYIKGLTEDQQQDIIHQVGCVLHRNKPFNRGFYLKLNGWGGNTKDVEWMEDGE